MKLLLLSFLVSLTSLLHAQEKFIEVTVSDTVLAEAQILVYRVTMSNNDAFDMSDTAEKDYPKVIERRP